MTKKYGPPNAAHNVAALMRMRGIAIDAERLERDARLQRSRETADFNAYRGEVDSPAAGAP